MKQSIYKEGDILSTVSSAKYEIETSTDAAIHSSMFRNPQVHDEEFEQMLKDGIIRQSVSPYNSPIVLVVQK